MKLKFSMCSCASSLVLSADPKNTMTVRFKNQSLQKQNDYIDKLKLLKIERSSR